MHDPVGFSLFFHFWPILLLLWLLLQLSSILFSSFSSLRHLTSLALHLRTILVWFVVVFRPRRFLTLFALFTYWPTRSALAPSPTVCFGSTPLCVRIIPVPLCVASCCCCCSTTWDIFHDFHSIHACVCQSVCVRECVRVRVSVCELVCILFGYFRLALNALRSSLSVCHKRKS